MFDEFEERVNQVIYTSATPGGVRAGARQHRSWIRSSVRPVSSIPQIIVLPTKGQIDDLVGRIRERIDHGQRVLVTTLTKRMSEDLSDYLRELDFKVNYLHSEVETLERVEILRDLRLGQYDVIVGINLLREGLDLPEVSLVAILDADKQGFLRSATSLIQTVGRAARHVEGTVLMYADSHDRRHARRPSTRPTAAARSRSAYNTEHGIEPQTIVKEIRDLTDRVRIATQEDSALDVAPEEMEPAALEKLIRELEKEMRTAADNWEFEKAAGLRDQIFDLRGVLESKAPLWKRDRKK